MAISRIASQDARGTSTTASVTATYPATPTAGNLLIASVHANVGPGATSLTGWSIAKSQEFSAGAQCVIIFYRLADGTESGITANATGATQMRLHIYEYTGNANPIQLDGSNGATSGTTNVTSLASGDITTTNADDLLFAALATGGSTTSRSFSNSFSARLADAANVRLADADRIVAATGTYGTTATWNTGLRAGIAIAAFKAAGAPPPSSFVPQIIIDP